MSWYQEFGLDEPQEKAEEESEEAVETEDTEEAQTEEQTDAGSEDDDGGRKTKQSSKENSKYAAARRQAERERDAAIEEVKQQAQADMDKLIAGMKLTNPYTKQPITTKAEYDEYQKTHGERTRDKLKRDGNLSDEDYEALVGEVPEVRQARKIVQDNEARQREEMRRQVEQEIAEISRLDPSIKDAQDLQNQPDYPAIYAKIEQGYTLIDAFRTVRFDRLRAEPSRQAELNRRGKQHLEGTQSRGQGSATVPKGERAWANAFGFSDKEYSEWYQSRH